jgi:Family of unknown function (DUF6064)
MLPFTAEQFHAVFAAYNAAVWPAQAVAYALGLLAVAALFRPGRDSGRSIALVLALMWLWTGIAYHGLFFSAVNPAAYGFAALFVVEGLGFLHAGVVRGRLAFGVRRDLASVVGLAFVGYALILYPLIGLAAGDGWSALPMFGITPCPVTIFTFGLFLLAKPPVPRWLLVIPVLWSLVGGSAALLLAVPQDWLLLVSGIIAVPLIFLRSRALRLRPS